MKPYFIFQSIIFACLFLCNGCVELPSDPSPDSLFSLKISGKDFKETKIIADNSISYKINIECLEGVEIDDAKTVSLHASVGNVSNASAPNTLATNINIALQNGKGSFLYYPGRIPKKEAVFTLTVEGLSQAFTFQILPSEPAEIALAVLPEAPKANDAMELKAYLLRGGNSSEECSDNLQIDFLVEKVNSQDAIEAQVIAPAFAYSKFDEQQSLVLASKKLMTNNQTGKLRAIAKYKSFDNKIIVDTLIVEVKQ